MRIKECNTFTAKIYIGGSLQVAEQIIRQHCFEVGLCVTVDKTKFIYTGGEEEGVVVGLINYPRFPKKAEEVVDEAEKLMKKLLDGLYQKSCLVEYPNKTVWWSIREEDL